jgi:hypothetical protein
MGVVIESPDGNHAVVKVDRIAAVKVSAESPYRASIPRVTPMAGPRCA